MRVPEGWGAAVSEEMGDGFCGERRGGGGCGTVWLSQLIQRGIRMLARVRALAGGCVKGQLVVVRILERGGWVPARKKMREML